MVIKRCGGHITLLFSICNDSKLPRSQGSRGAGFNVTDGVEANVRHLWTNKPASAIRYSAGSSLDEVIGDIKQGDLRINVTAMDGSELQNGFVIYHELIEGLRDARLLDREDAYEINVQLELPTSQGFGMSAAGLIAVALAFHQLTGKGKVEQYYRLAHRIERIHSGGLGDVLGIYAGGVELRIEAGSPVSPGKAVGFPCNQKILLAWIPQESRHTGEYIDDPKWQQTITSAGEKAVSTLRQGQWSHDKWPQLLQCSKQFSEASGMLDEPVRKAFLSNVDEEIKQLGFDSSMSTRLCMLGVSLCVLPKELSKPLPIEKLEELSEQLRKRGMGVRITNIDS
jgi:pantoate kinase